ncbi:hypothetical protein EV179_004285 [Coemansia sp. RSA 487]|nr:hypothetical protein EV179_004285 [Coemansia sp. RSA 487]
MSVSGFSDSFTPEDSASTTTSSSTDTDRTPQFTQQHHEYSNSNSDAQTSSASTNNRNIEPHDAMTAATPKSLFTNDALPLTQLEERVFQKEPIERRGMEYSVLNDDNVLKMCDDDVEQAALADAAAADTANTATAPHGLAAHGWRIDNVIDKYGNRIASGSKRLARMVVQRKAPGSSEASSQPYQSGSTSQVAATLPTRNPLHVLQNKHSVNGSPSMALGAHSAHLLSPKAGYVKLAATDTAVTSTTPTSPTDRIYSQGPLNRTGSISKKRTSDRAEPYTRGRARRKQGSSLDSATAFISSQTYGTPQRGGGGGGDRAYDDIISTSHGDGGGNSIAAAGVLRLPKSAESGSFELENFSAGDSTSTILQQRERAGSEGSANTRRWWQSIFRKSHTRAPPTSVTSQEQQQGPVPLMENLQKMTSTGTGYAAAAATAHSPRIPFAGRIGGGSNSRQTLDHQQHHRDSPRPAAGHYRRIKDGSSSTADTNNIIANTHGKNQAAISDTIVDIESKEPGTAKRTGPFSNAVHKFWAKATEFVMPGGYNRFGARDESSYTEWIGFLIAFALASVAFIMWGTLVPKALCSTDQTFTIDDVQSRRFVAANGIVSDFLLSQNPFGHTMRGYVGYDISSVFPMLGQLSPDTRSTLSSTVASMLEKCISDEDTVANFMELWMSNSTLYRGPLEDFPELCPFPQSPQSSGARCMVSSWSQFESSKVGMLKINGSEINQRHASPATSWVIIDDMVYDVSLYVQYATDPIVHNGTVDSSRQLRNDSMFLPKPLTQLFIDKPGTDITKDFRDLDIDTVLYQQCMDNLFFRGTTQATKTPFACANTNIVAWVTFGLYFLVLFSRMVIAEIYGRVRTRKAVLAMNTYEGKLAAADASNIGNIRSSDSAVDARSNSNAQDVRDSGSNISVRPDDGQQQYRANDPNADAESSKESQPMPHNGDEKPMRNGLSFSPSVMHTPSERHLEAGVSGGTGDGHGIAKCLIVVPCFQESLETLTRTLQGIARSIHADSHKILWVINDGDSETLSNIMQILAHSGHVSDPKFYGAYGVDVGGVYGSARVYSGFYECGRHRIPYIVTAKDIYQGRVDTLMMMLNFFRSMRQLQQQRVGDEANEADQHQLEPQSGSQTIFLEEEVEACLTALGHPPATVDYCMMIDGGVQVDPLALTQFVARMDRNSGIIALSGSLYPVGQPTTLLHVLQFFEFYLRHFVSPICESLSHVTCPLNQLFTIYRVNLASGEPCLGDDELVASMDSLMKSSVRYRHRTWPGNDCLLVPRMTRRFLQYHWSFEPNARAEFEFVANKMVAFDPYERQWFRTRLVTLIDIARGGLRKRTWPIMFAHLIFPFVAPAATCMLYLEIVISLFGDNPAIVVSELTAGFVAATLLLFLVCGKWRLAIYFTVYSVIALPFYHVWIPVTSFFSMNRIWYPPEQLEAQAVAAEAQIQPPENFEAMKDSYMRRFSSARGNSHKRNNSSQSSTGVGTNSRQKQRPTPANYADRPGMEDHDGSSDSEPELVEYPHDPLGRSYRAYEGTENGLGLSMVSPKQQEAPPMQPINLANVVVSDALMAETQTVLQRVLRDYPQGIEPESTEFYVVCERVLKALILAYPSSSVAELAVSVDRAIDKALKGTARESTDPTTRDVRKPAPPAPLAAAGYNGISGMRKFTKKNSYGWNSGRPVSVIMEESDIE